MNKRFCRGLSFFAAALLLLAVPAFSGAAVRNPAEQACGEHLTWSLDDEGLLTIRGTGDMYSFTEHAPWNYFNVREVVLEDGVTAIGDRAFSDCYFLKQIRIPASVTRIGDYAFYRCYRLKSITLPDRLCEIGANPFVYCNMLQEIVLSPDHPVLSAGNGMLSSKPDRRLVCRLQAEPSDRCAVPEGTETIGDYAFADCENLLSVCLPEGVSVIGSHAFSGCSILTIRDYPRSLVSVGDYAFSGCRHLGYVAFHEGLKSIGDCAFTHCWYLRGFDLPDTLTYLGKHPFDDCRGLSEFRLSEGHPLLGVKDDILYTKPDRKMVFCLAGNPAGTFTVPQGIAVIGERAFTIAAEITKIILPDSVREIEREGFSSCGNVEEIVFSPGLETIGERAFYNMTGLKEIVLPEGLAVIGDEAFAGCSGLAEILIPESVESIGEGAFDGTDTLNLVVFAEEGSAAEAYCIRHSLITVCPGQEAPEPETELPPAFVTRYPGYRGAAELTAWTDGETGEAVYLARKPEGTPVLLCGTMRGEEGWTVIESAPLPEAARVILSEGRVMLDLGSARCTVRRYSGDTWGIDSTGWRNMWAGPQWIGYYYPTALYYGKHPWGDLTAIDWRTVTEDLRAALRLVDVSGVTITHCEDPDGRIPLYMLPDSGSGMIAAMMDGVPMQIEEKGNEWTRVSLGSGTDNRWKIEGWIRTEDLLFPEKADIDRPFGTARFLYPVNGQTVTLVTPSGSEAVSGFNDLRDTWLAIGEKTESGQEYWLFYECNTEQAGFVPKEELREPNG